jgi:hypothetical protein
MPESRKVVDGYIGMDDAVKIYSLIHAGLVAAGFSENTDTPGFVRPLIKS